MTNVFEYELKQYLETNGNKFYTTDTKKIMTLIVKSDVSIADIRGLKLKSPTTAKILSIFLGFFGIDRFYAGNYIIGLLKLLTGGFWIIGWMVDIALIQRAVKLANEDKLVSLLTGKKVHSKVSINTMIENLKSPEGKDALKGLAKGVKGITNSIVDDI